MHYITHITLQTAHSRHCERSEVDGNVIDYCRELITAALINPNKPVPMPSFDGYFFSGGHLSGNGLFGTVWRGAVPLATIIVALKSRNSLKLWQELHRHATLPPATDANSPPSVPWLAASLHASATSDLDAMQWLGDFERCLAWAWVDY